MRFAYQVRDDKIGWYTACGFEYLSAATQFAMRDDKAPARIVDRKFKSVAWRDEYRGAGGEEYD